MRIANLVLIAICLLGAACSAQPSTVVPGTAAPVSQASPVPPPTATAAPTLQVVTGSQIPAGKILFVELSVQVVRSSGCDRSFADSPKYAYENGTLRLPPNLLKSPTELNTIKGFFGRVQILTGEAGFGTYNDMKVIPTIPYIDTVLPNGPYSQAPNVKIIGASSRGEVYAEIEGQTLKLRPDESWQDQSENGDVMACHMTVTRTFTNYGLLDKGQVKQ